MILSTSMEPLMCAMGSFNLTACLAVKRDGEPSPRGAPETKKPAEGGSFAAGDLS